MPNKHSVIAFIFSIFTIMIVGKLNPDYQVYLLVTVGLIACGLFYMFIRMSYHILENRPPSKLKRRYILSMLVAWIAVTLLILLFEITNMPKLLNEIERQHKQAALEEMKKPKVEINGEQHTVVEYMPSMFQNVLWDSKSGVHGYRYVCFNDRIIYIHYGGNKWATYAPDYWLGLSSACKNWPHIKKKMMLTKTVKIK